MNKYVIVTPRYGKTEHKTVQGDSVVTVQFMRTEMYIQAKEVEEAMKEAKKFPVSNPIIERVM